MLTLPFDEPRGIWAQELTVRPQSS